MQVTANVVQKLFSHLQSVNRISLCERMLTSRDNLSYRAVLNLRQSFTQIEYFRLLSIPD